HIVLTYIDAHSDFNTPAESGTGSAAGMSLGMAAGRGDTPLALSNVDRPFGRGSDAALTGTRDDDDPYVPGALAPACVPRIAARGMTWTGSASTSMRISWILR